MMPEEPEKNQLPDPAGSPLPESSDPVELPERTGSGSLIRRVTASLRRVTGNLRPLPDESPAESEGEETRPTGRLGRPKPAADQSYINEIRQDLTSEEAQKPERQGFFKRITRSLRGTKSLPPQQPPAPPAAPEVPPTAVQPEAIALPDIEDDFLTGRLAESGLETDTALEMGPGETIFSAIVGEASDTPEAVDEEDDLFALPGGLEEAGPLAQDAGEPDWMAAIRQEEIAAAPDSPGLEGLPGSAGHEDRESGGGLRSFFSGIFGGQEGRQSGEAELTDEELTGRLGRSLNTEPLAEAVETPVEDPLLAGPALEAAEDWSQEDAWSQFEAKYGDQAAGEGQPVEAAAASFDDFEISDEDVFADDLGARFGQVLGGAAPESAQAADEAVGYQLSPEDEALLWGAQEEDLPAGQTAEVDDLPDVYPPVETPAMFRQITDDDYAASFLGGHDLDRREQEARQRRAQEQASIGDIRAVALEGYRDIAPPSMPRVDQSEEESGAQAEPGREPETAGEAAQAAGDTGWKAQLARSTTLQKIFLLEAVLVLVALVAAVPFFISALMAGPVEVTPVVAPRALPADLPYPTGVTLPGGWYFKLEKSTFIDGTWKPVRGEWLEGTELRRVVAVPWSLQTEAVVQTFQEGDPVKLYLNNSSVLNYRVDSIERVLTSNVEVLTDSKPSLLLILHKEDSPERWVIICRP